MPKQNQRRIWAVYLAADVLAICLAYFAAYWIRFKQGWSDPLYDTITVALGTRGAGEMGPRFEVFYQQSAPRIILLLVLTICLLYALRDLYTDRRFILRRPVGADVIVANIIALGLFYAYFYLRRNVFHPRSYFATVMAINIVACISLRGFADWLLTRLRRRGIDCCPVLLVGRTREAELVKTIIQATQPHGLCLQHHLEPEPNEAFESLLARIEQGCRDHHVGMLVVADKGLSVVQIMEILEVANAQDLPVKIASDKLDVLMFRARIRFDMISGVPLIHFEAPSVSRRFLRWKLAGAYSVALVASLLLLPLLLVIALAIRLTSRGPVLFVQERIGINRRPFLMYKFRTMYARADEVQAQVEEFNESGRGLFKMRHDPRVTPVGRFLRRYSLDELPQLMNVLRGEMTLVGPRPLPRRDFGHYYENWHYSRHNGLPGLTCLWQVSGRSELDFESMCILDVFYLRNQSWILDLKILLRTSTVVLFAEGAY